MDNPKSPFRIKWRYFFLGYVALSGLSFLSLQGGNKADFALDIPTINEEKKTVLYLGDPLMDNQVVLSELLDSYNVIEVEYEASSFKQIADLISQYQDSLYLEDIHVIGEGIGGSIAVHLVSANDSAFSSLALISANGIDELELLGGYYLNHAIYNVRRAFGYFLKYGIPHFGLFERVDTIILRNEIQFKSDQRLIRDLFPGIKIPARVYHLSNAKIGEDVSAEHARLLPQSELFILDNYGELASDYRTFLTEVENGSATDRSQVSNFAEQQSLAPFDPSNGIKVEGRALLILMLVIIISTFVSEDLTCIGTGLMIARGLIGFTPGVVACLLGIFIGDILLYLSGRWLGANALNRVPLKWFISEKDIQLSYHWFEAKGPAIIIASRFIPGSRFPTYFSAGAIRANFGTFILYFGIASLIWTPILVGLAVLLGQEMIGYFTIYQDYALWVLVGVLILLFFLFKIIIPLFTFKGRRLFVGKLKRIIHWEFWSPYLLYAPVLLYAVFLWVKHRSISLVTLVNPGFKDGGFIKESKVQILDSINEKQVVANYSFISSELKQDEKIDHLNEFLRTHKLDYPIVIKPDVGERGRGVHIIESISEARQVLQQDIDLIVQEYVAGKEFGVFYYRFPNDEKGKIFSVTRKEYMNLTGDGKHTLEYLILKDPRAVCLAQIHFEQHIDELFTIPGKGTEIPLVRIGTHARGSIFLDASGLITPALTKRIDEISKTINGFYFGRYDIKVPSEEDFKNGENLTVLEVNGVTSEATHIYDPKYSFVFAVRTLMKQWRIAYEIAEEVKRVYPSLKAPGPGHILSLLR